VNELVPRNASQAMECLATIVRCKMGETIYYQEGPADYWYRILSGAARKSALLADGRRQIVDFLLPGDLFGFGTREGHRFSVEVIAEGTTVARYPRRRIEMLAEANPEVGRRIRETAFDSISRLQTRMVLLGRTSALEKVCAFLLEMADRTGADPPSSSVWLPMSRYDIADYLAIAVETVSRTLTELRRRGAIALSGARFVRIVDRTALEDGAEEVWPEISSSRMPQESRVG
jgi:CRP/FNR family nitrogen fixation transcriptional regulator